MNEFCITSYQNTKFVNSSNGSEITRSIRALDYKSTDLHSGNFCASRFECHWFNIDNDFQDLIFWFETNFSNVCFWNLTLKYLLSAPETIVFQLPKSKTYQGYVGSKYIQEISQAFLSFSSLSEEELSKSKAALFLRMKEIVTYPKSDILQFIFWKKD